MNTNFNELAKIRLDLSQLSVTDLMEMPPPTRILWKKWSKHLSNEEKKIIEMFRGPIKREFSRNGLILEFVVQPVEVDSDSWGDYGTDLIIDKYGYKVLDQPYLIFELLLHDEDQIFEPFLSSGLYLKHNIPTLKSKKIMVDILKKHLGCHLQWNGDPKKTIKISKC